MHNRIDWCVRGYSHGFYNRGQDSAGLLMYEQSSNNIVAYNSVTHGGDGLFLWAGQSTMDTGQGRRERQPVLRRTISATRRPTASRRRSAATRSSTTGSRSAGTASGAATATTRSGSGTGSPATPRASRSSTARTIVFASNTFDGDETAIRLWQNATQDPNWGYPKNRDTRSRDYIIQHNTFTGNKVALDSRSNDRRRVRDNKFDEIGTQVLTGGDAEALASTRRSSSRTRIIDSCCRRRCPAASIAMIKDGERRGRNTIIVDEWGPYDWKSPKLWPARDQPDDAIAR